MTGSAEILFFTGVRYYRMPEEVQPQTVVRRRRRSMKSAKAVQVRTPRHPVGEPASA